MKKLFSPVFLNRSSAIMLLIIPALMSSKSFAETNKSIVNNLFHEIVKVNSGIRTIDAHITQYINTPEHSREVFKGRYRSDNKGRFRIDFSAPEKQIVLNDNKNLYWYFPENNLLYLLDEKNDPTARNINPLKDFLIEEFEKRFEVIYLGKHLFGFFSVAHQFAVKDLKNKITIDLWVDAKSKALLTKIVKDQNDAEIIKEIYSDYVQEKKIYFPKRVDVYARTINGIIKNTTEYSNIKINYIIPDNIFSIEFPKNVVKKALSEK